MSIAPTLLNEALCAYVHTFPARERLAEHLAQRGLEDQRGEIESELGALLKTAEQYLWNYPGGVPWTDSFQRDYREKLSEKHPWLNATALERVMAFSRWFCWHEGLNAEDE